MHSPGHAALPIRLCVFVSAAALAACDPHASSSTKPASQEPPTTAAGDNRLQSASTQTSEAVRHTLSVLLKVRPEKLPLNATWNELGVDSLDFVELLMAMEEDFKVEIPDAEVEKLATPDDLIRFVAARAK